MKTAFSKNAPGCRQSVLLPLPLSSHSDASNGTFAKQRARFAKLSRGRDATAFNAFALMPPNLACGLATNISAEPVTAQTAADWLQVAPYHSGSYWQQENGKWVEYTQVFTKEQADKMVAAFNTQAMKKGASFRGLPVYSGHPDVDPTRWPDERRLGGVVNLAARVDGLYARISWNTLGTENQKEAFLVYPSPAWLYNQQAARQTKVIRPDELRSVGMTYSPRIADAAAWNHAPGSGAVGPGFRALALNADLADRKAPLPLILRVTSPAKQAAALEPDLSTPEGRSRAFKQRVDQLMLPKEHGGGGLTLDAAVREMRTNPGDAALLKTMGA